MPSEPVPRQPGRDKNPRSAAAWPDWMDDPAYLAPRAADEDVDEPHLDQDPAEASPPPDTDPDELAGEADRIAGEQARAAGFASGMPLDTAPGSLNLARFAEDAAGSGDRYRDASDDELAGAKAAFRVGTLSERKAAIIASATALLDPDQARGGRGEGAGPGPGP